MVVLEFMMMSFGALNVLEAKERINQRMRELPVEINNKTKVTLPPPPAHHSQLKISFWIQTNFF
jgi:hypothetical protein